ncbi:MAG TPA: type II secretion system minor pseudopilin GspK [Sphingomicrobium sp.]|nr:type II secretion system minor pseudopilin GspK [Sphingomicrobium sp.]
MIAPHKERGVALLSVLLLVAVMATVAATALDRIGIGTRLAANAATIGQGRAWIESAELLATTRIEDLLAADERKTLGAGWLGLERRISLPGGAAVRARLEDGGNCFNLNSLVLRQDDGRLVARPQAVNQFAALMTMLGIGGGEAARIAAAASDYIDSDSFPQKLGAEDGGRVRAANQLMADLSELRAVAGVTDRHYRLLSRWICALPRTELSEINVNTLLPEQSPLVAMIAPGRIDPQRARAALQQRPAGGFDDPLDFWQLPGLAGIDVPSGAVDQTKLRTSFFILKARVESSDIDLRETALIDARETPARVVRRSWAEAS